MRNFMCAFCAHMYINVCVLCCLHCDEGPHSRHDFLQNIVCSFSSVFICYLLWKLVYI